MAGASLAVLAGPAWAADASAQQPAANPPQSAAAEIGEIVVTAQKREESINSVGMTISAISGSDLTTRGVSTTSDLGKVVAGLSVVPNGTGITGAPVYTLRGIGFVERSLSSLSAVSFSNDEMPLPYVRMTAGPSLDLQRVEVLKGPQGTLYGQNSTGGAVNFISNKPTEDFVAGGELGYGSYNRFDASGFVSGPLTDTLRVRLALRSITADGWQNSISRPGDHQGSVDTQAARLIVDWAPIDNLRFELTVNGWQDHSQSQAAQLIGVQPSLPVDPLTGAPLSAANYPFFNAVFKSPVVPPTDPKAADWTPGLDYKNRNYFSQVGFRADWDVTPDITLTSITAASYIHYKTFASASGTTTTSENFGAYGKVAAYSQEMRLAGSSFDGRLHWIAGMNFARDKINDNQVSPDGDSTLFYFFGIKIPYNFSNEVRKTQAGFASADFDLTSKITLTGGVRYTADQLKFNGCGADGGDGTLAAFATGGLVGPGQCITFLDETGPDRALPFPFNFDSADFGLVRKKLDETNVSWRIGVNWKPVDGTLLYANVSRGFKGGNIPTLSALFESQYEGVKQEEVTSYEAGFKSRLFGDTLQLNAAAFHSDYINKQLYVFINNPIFGTAESTVNIPTSVVDGAELEAALRPLSGLTLQANVTYTKTRIKEGPACPPPFTSAVCVYAGYSYPSYPGGPPSALANLKGQAFNLSPKWQANFDAEYRWGLTEALNGFVGGSVVYQSSDTATIGASTGQVVGGFATIDQTMPSYTTLDLRAGVEMKNGKWRLMVWGRNVTNKLYVTAVARGFDTVARYTGMPATFGATLGFNFQ